MAWAGGATAVGKTPQGKFQFNQTNFDADAENGIIIDLNDYANLMGQPFIPQYANLWVTSAHAATVTDTVSFKLFACINTPTGTANWDELGEVTDADLDNASTTTGFSDTESATAFPTVGYRYFQLRTTTVGAGNTLRGYVELW